MSRRALSLVSVDALVNRMNMQEHRRAPNNSRCETAAQVIVRDPHTLFCVAAVSCLFGTFEHWALNCKPDSRVLC